MSSDESNLSTSDPNIRIASRLAEAPGDVSLGLFYGNGESAPPTAFSLNVDPRAFAGMLFVTLAAQDVVRLGNALRERSGTAGGFEVKQTVPAMVSGRSDVISLFFPRSFPGAFYVIMDHASADRLAYQCDTMPHEFERRQPGYTGPDAEPMGQA